MTSPEAPAPARPFVLPLPRFGRQPINDPALPEETDDPTPTEPVIGPTLPTSDRPEETEPAAGPPPLPDLSPERRPRTATYSVGDPKVGARIVSGLIALACGLAFTAFARRGLRFRQPSRSQVDDIALPLGRIIGRHLPTDVIGPDLLDGIDAAAATHGYLIDGPLVHRPDSPLPEEYPS